MHSQAQAALALLSLSLALPVSAQNEYVVQPSADLIHMQVAARIRMAPEATINMSGFGAWGHDNGWGTFVRNLEATDCQGSDISLASADRLTWRLERPTPTVCLTYELDFEQAVTESWPDGPRTTGMIRTPEALFTNGGALFLYSDTTVSATVEFTLPANQSVTAPWDALSPTSFEAHLTSLKGNALVIGSHRLSDQTVGPLRIRTVMLGDFASAIGLVDQAVTAVARQYLSIYPDTPASEFLFVWFEDGGWETGEAYDNSFAVATSVRPSTDTRLIWPNSIAHELHHYWLGHLVSSSDWAATNWFVEGATEYLANLAIVRSGLVSEAQYTTMVGKHLALFYNFQFRWGTPYERISLVEAGSEKSTNNVAVYDGGWFAALLFEVRMREASDGQVGLEDLIGALLSRYHDSEFDPEDIVTVAEEISGATLGADYDNYINGRRKMPIQQLLEAAGFEATTTPYVTSVSLSDDPEDSSLRIRRAMLRGSNRSACYSSADRMQPASGKTSKDKGRARPGPPFESPGGQPDYGTRFSFFFKMNTPSRMLVTTTTPLSKYG